MRTWIGVLGSSKQIRAVVLLSTFFLLGVTGRPHGVRGNDPQPFAAVVGPERIVFDWSRSACSSDEIPDLPVRAFRDYRGRAQLIISHYVNRRLVGRDINHVRRDCKPVLSSGFSANPAVFADREWLASLYTSDGRYVVALLHTEYQGHRHPGRCPSGAYFACWYNAITLATSRDGGTSYRHTRPPNQLVAVIPQTYRPDAGPAGMFEPSNIVRNPKDGYFYVLARVIGYGGKPRGTCVLRTRTLADPSSWRAWSGYAFEVRFRDPYQAPPNTGQFCEPVANAEIGEMTESLTFNTVLGRFLLVGMSTGYDSGRGATVTGVFYSASDDLINWSQRRLLFEASRVQTHRCGSSNPIGYPSVIDPSSRSRSFETSDERAYLYFTRFNYKGCKQTLDRDLVRVQIVIGQTP